MTPNGTATLERPVERAAHGTPQAPIGGVWLPFGAGDPVRQFATILFIRGGLIAIAVTLVGGMLGAPPIQSPSAPQLPPPAQSAS